MKFVTKSALAALFMTAMVPSVARAQESRLSLAFTPAVASVGGDAELALAGTVDYRFTDHFSFEGDVTWIDAAAGGFRNRVFELDSRATPTNSIGTLLQNIGSNLGGRNRLPGINLPDFTRIVGFPIGIPDLGRLSASTDGQTWIGTMGVRFEPMVQTSWFRPYVSGGLGLNFTDQEFEIEAASTTRLVDESVSHTGLAFGAGGGATIKLTEALWLGADLKYFRLSRDRDLMRAGGGVTFKF